MHSWLRLIVRFGSSRDNSCVIMEVFLQHSYITVFSVKHGTVRSICIF